jgi:hypothetical protein
MHFSGLTPDTVRTMIYVRNDLANDAGRLPCEVPWADVARHIVRAAPYFSRVQAAAASMDGRGRIGYRAHQLTSAARDLSREDRRYTRPVTRGR